MARLEPAATYLVMSDVGAVDAATSLDIEEIIRHYLRRRPLVVAASKDAYDAAMHVALSAGEAEAVRGMQALLVEAYAHELAHLPHDELRRLVGEVILPTLRSDSFGVSVGVAEHLASTKHLPEILRLRYQDVQHGRVSLDTDGVRFLLTHHLMQAYAVQPPLAGAAVAEELKGLRESLRRGLGRRKAENTRIRGLGLRPSHYPPCIASWLHGLQEGEPIPHLGRFTLVAFMHHQGASRDGIVDLFRGVSGFDEAKTRYQVDHIAGARGTAYQVPACSKLRDYGLCPSAECGGRTPVREYAWRVRGSSRRGYREASA